MRKQKNILRCSSCIKFNDVCINEVLRECFFLVENLKHVKCSMGIYIILVRHPFILRPLPFNMF